ncbi:MAG: PepSY domain-containing protein [Paenirhodobacter sp.]|uniref:PepSY domain-containing protein n=1 Tax=Paenirhodobacter sp. TaxID=1965326 RepID=UPI003D14BAE4
MRLPLLLLSILLSGAAGLPVAAQGSHDHNQAQSARARGEIQPLHAILPQVERTFGARLLEVELEPRNGRLIYELKLIKPNGRIFEAVVDAATGAIVPDDTGDED